MVDWYGGMVDWSRAMKNLGFRDYLVLIFSWLLLATSAIIFLYIVGATVAP